MPINYNESQVSGTKWTRCHTVICNNPLVPGPGSQKGVMFLEEGVINIEGNIVVLSNSGNQINVEYNPNGQFPLLNPLTGNPVGGFMTHDQLYQALFSLYRYSAEQRDLQQSNP